MSGRARPAVRVVLATLLLTAEGASAVDGASSSIIAPDASASDPALVAVRPERPIPTATSLRALPGLPAALRDEDFRPVDPAVAALGRSLFFDPLLSGNRNIACATCHHPSLASADGLSLGIGEGGVGLGLERRASEPVKHRVPRHAPALFNLGAHEIERLFNDGRVAVDADEPYGFDTPAEEFLPRGLDSVLAAQALFPLVAEVEMAGAAEENEVAGAKARRVDYAWREIVTRLRDTPGYDAPFANAFPAADGWRIELVGNALAAFMEREWRADASAFDAFLAGEDDALEPSARAGLALFYGDAGCARCHAGPLQTDHEFHALALPPFGPGRTRLFDPLSRDVGRLAETDRFEDAYRFRTPSLRNVARTAPYGHNGSFATLEGVVRHHLDPLRSLDAWFDDRLARDLPLGRGAALTSADLLAFEDAREMTRYRRHLDIEPVALDDGQLVDLIAFLHALTDERSVRGMDGAPTSVPSGLPLDALGPVGLDR